LRAIGGETVRLVVGVRSAKSRFTAIPSFAPSAVGVNRFTLERFPDKDAAAVRRSILYFAAVANCYRARKRLRSSSG